MRLYLIRVAPNPVTGVLMRKQGFGHRDTEETLEETHVKREAEMVVMYLHAKEHQGLLAATRS